VQQSRDPDGEGKLVPYFGRRFRRRKREQTLNELAAVIAAQMKAHGKTRYDFYRELGVDAKTVRRWLAGESIPDFRHAENLRELLGQEVFDAIEKARDARAEKSGAPRIDVFLASPLGAAGDDLPAAEAYARPLYDALVAAGRSVYWAAATIRTVDDFDPPAVALARSSDALLDARFLVYAQVPGLHRPSSALIQAGMALARHMPVTVVCESEAELPSLFQTDAHHIYRTMREFAPVQVVTVQNFVRYVRRFPEFDFLEVVY